MKTGQKHLDNDILMSFNNFSTHPLRSPSSQLQLYSILHFFTCKSLENSNRKDSSVKYLGPVLVSCCFRSGGAEQDLTEDLTLPASLTLPWSWLTLPAMLPCSTWSWLTLSAWCMCPGSSSNGAAVQLY